MAESTSVYTGKRGTAIGQAFRLSTRLQKGTQGAEAQSGGGLVVAARAKHVQDHQLRVREKPLFGFGAGHTRGTDQRAKMLQLSQFSEVFQANPRHV
jgi:hypothetical protein